MIPKLEIYLNAYHVNKNPSENMNNSSDMIKY